MRVASTTMVQVCGNRDTVGSRMHFAGRAVSKSRVGRPWKEPREDKVKGGCWLPSCPLNVWMHHLQGMEKSQGEGLLLAVGT